VSRILCRKSLSKLGLIVPTRAKSTHSSRAGGGCSALNFCSADPQVLHMTAAARTRSSLRQAWQTFDSGARDVTQGNNTLIVQALSPKGNFLHPIGLPLATVLQRQQQWQRNRRFSIIRQRAFARGRKAPCPRDLSLWIDGSARLFHLGPMLTSHIALFPQVKEPFLICQP